MKKVSRRAFIKMLLAAPVIGAVGVISTVGHSSEQKLPKALLVDPFLVHMKDIKNCKMPKGTKIIRLRRPYWGRGEPIRRIF